MLAAKSVVAALLPSKRVQRRCIPQSGIQVAAKSSLQALQPRRQRRPMVAAQAEDRSTPAVQPALDVDAELLNQLRPLIGAVCREMASHYESCREAGTTRVAEEALAAAEANGAVPPLAEAQRDALLGALGQAAEACRSVDCEGDLPLGVEGDEAATGLEEGVPFSFTPLAKELFETLINMRTHPAPRAHSAAPRDSVAAGGEVGNISLRAGSPGSGAGGSGGGEPRGVPAEGRTERTEREAERQFMDLELGDPEGGRVHGSLPKAKAGAPTAAPSRLPAPHDLEHSLVLGEGDAPAAGDGMQVLGDASEDALRPMREHYQRREEATEGS